VLAQAVMAIRSCDV